MERQFKRSFLSISDIFQFVNSALADRRPESSVILSIQLVIEELFTNMVKYNTNSTNDITIRIATSADRTVVTLIDVAAKPFDPRTTGEVDVKKPIEERPVGGLGIHLVRKMVDNLDYEHANGEDRITFTMKLEH